MVVVRDMTPSIRINSPQSERYQGENLTKDLKMPIGTVKWFNNAKGFGFILPENGDEDLFAHYSSIEMDGYKTLKAGQTVTFDVIKGDKGLHATNIRAPEADASAETGPKSQPDHFATEDA